MDKNTTKSVITEYLSPLNHNFLLASIQSRGLDRYVKKLHTFVALQLFVFAQLMQTPSYASLSLLLNTNRKLQKTVGLSSISTAQLSRKWRDLDHSFLAYVFSNIAGQATKKFGSAKTTQKLRALNLVDASTITMCLSKYRWATYSKKKAGVRLHLRFIHSDAASFPEKVVLTSGNVHERKYMGELVSADKEVLNIFDRGYVDYKKFDTYCNNGVRFVTRLRQSACMKVLEERAVASDANVGDATVLLGSDVSAYKMKNPLRLITCFDEKGEQVLICTNDFELSVEEIADIYRNRWQIEIFFKWIKQHLHVKHFYGTSRNAVYNQIYAALIAYCLVLLTRDELHYRGTLWELTKSIRMCWHENLVHFVKLLFRPPKQKSGGRQKSKAERLFKETQLQYESGECDHLDDLTYDPIS
ncbi:IS4 family transposase [Cohnella abietis]|nr:IS4 family transposase [Cohnella abietis]